jgi:hypothetical protein
MWVLTRREVSAGTCRVRRDLEDGATAAPGRCCKVLPVASLRQALSGEWRIGRRFYSPWR